MSFAHETLEMHSENIEVKSQSQLVKNKNSVQSIIKDLIIGESNKKALRFKKLSNSSIQTLAGKEYSDHWTACYCAGSEDVEGILMISNNTLIFTATTDYEQEKQTKILGIWSKKPSMKDEYLKGIGNFQVVINIQDIVDCNTMAFSVPSSGTVGCNEKIQILQLHLHGHGKHSFNNELDHILPRMKTNGTAYASVFFNTKSETKQNNSSETLSQIQQKIKNLMASSKHSQELGLCTNLPYFDFIAENFDLKEKNLINLAKRQIRKSIKESIQLFKEKPKSFPVKEKNLIPVDSASMALNEIDQTLPRPKKPMRRIIHPTLANQSSITTNDQMAQIISSVPDLYQMMEWKLLYSSVLHGTSFRNLMRRAKSANPFLIICRDNHDNILGAYGSDSLKSSLSYYGTGETFLFSFKQSEEIKDYHWSKKNDMYIFVNEEGIMFGAGPFYGLWIDSELSRGRTHECDTFNNQLLSSSTDFDITKIEVWTVTDPFAGK